MERLRNFDFLKHKPSLAFTLLAVAVIAGAGAITVYLVLYKIAADAPLSRLTYGVLNTFRKTSLVACPAPFPFAADLAASALSPYHTRLYPGISSGRSPGAR